MLESYLSPFLLSYVNKYIKNLKPEDLQVSLWGGDLVLKQLDLRLDVLEHELKLPISFLSGQIHELRIHVPWTRLGYEPVVVTINTIECVVKLKDEGAGDARSVSSKESDETKKSGDAVQENKQSPRNAQDTEFTPTYIQSLKNRIINNIHIVVNNLVLKYVEEDIVLSINIKSFESYAADAAWDQAFIELALPDLVLRRLCTFSDITVCLDKRNASGKIDVYQEPVIYRCAVTSRIHLTFNSLNSKRPSIFKVSTLCRQLNISLSDVQLPMFLRLMQLALALYYGTLDLSGVDAYWGSSVDPQPEAQSSQKDITDIPPEPPPGYDSQGWASWAWSYVPEIMYYEDDENEAGTGRRKMEDPVLSFGLYCEAGSITLKLTDTTSHASHFSTSKKLLVQPLLQIQGAGIAIEMLMKGEPFFNVEMGVSNMVVQGLANCTCGVDDFNITLDDTRDFEPFIKSGCDDLFSKETNFLTGSLFDPVCPENLRSPVEFILDVEKHQELYTESYGEARFGAFWSDYIFIMEKIENEGSETGSLSSVSSTSDLIFTFKEQSWKRFVLFPVKATISSSFIHRIQQLAFCAGSHEYEPYSRIKPEIVDVNRPTPTLDQVNALEENVPTRSTHVTLLDLSVTFVFAEHPVFTARPDVLQELSSIEPPVSLSCSSLPVLAVQVARMDVQTVVPMYARKLVKAVSKLHKPSSNLMHHCFAHFQLKLFGVKAEISTLTSCGEYSASAQCILPSVSAATCQKQLVLPMYWTDPYQVNLEGQLELPSLCVTLTKPQLLLLMHFYSSWFKSDYESDWLMETSLIADTFGYQGGTCSPGILRGKLSNVEMRFTRNGLVWAVNGSIESAHIFLEEQGGEVDDSRRIPIFHGPENVNKGTETRSDELLTFTVQIKRTLAKDDDALSVVLVDLQGISACLDPAINSWMLYQPQPSTSSKRKSNLLSPETSPSKQPSQQEASSDLQQRLPASKEVIHKPEDCPQATPASSDDPFEDSGEKQWIVHLVDILQQLILQVDIASSVIILPVKSLTVPPDAKITDFLYSHRRPSFDLCPLLVTHVPSVKFMSSGHQPVSANQEIPLDRMALPQEPGAKFPWSLKAANFSILTFDMNQPEPFPVLHPLAISSTVAFNCTSNSMYGSTVGFVVHTDLPGVHLRCGNEQVTLLTSLAVEFLGVIPHLLTAFNLQLLQGDSIHPHTIPPFTRQQSKTFTSRTSSGQPDTQKDTTTQSLSSFVETTSQDQSMPPSLDDDAETPNPKDVRVSLWTQWTVDKVGVELIANKVSGNPEHSVKLLAEMEDLTSSIDYQEVFSKVTCKVGSFSVKHMQKRSQSADWEPGPFKGVLFSSTHHITRNTNISQIASKEKAPSLKTSHFSLRTMKISDAKTHSFFSIVWTRALAKSIWEKLHLGRRYSEMETLDDKGRTKKGDFINEIILTVHPVDIVCWCPIIVDVLNMFTEAVTCMNVHQSNISSPQKLKHSSQSESHQRVRSRQVAVEMKSLKSSKRDGTFSSFQKYFTARYLPLLYLECQEIRFFLPTKEVTSSVSHRPKVKDDVDWRDLFIFQVSSVRLIPFADNPLQRLIIRKELFRKAEMSGSMNKPGATLEDRQYQLDLTGLGLYTALWDDIETVTNQSMDKLETGGKVSQNPALEWNTSPPRQEERVVQLTPVVQGFSLRVVAAPAMVSEKKGQGTSKPILVCGHSVEVNTTSNMSLYLSLSNITLAQELLANNFGSFLVLMPPVSTSSDEPSYTITAPSDLTRKSRANVDSGIESDVSMTTIRSREKTKSVSSVVGDELKSLPKVKKQSYKSQTVEKTPRTKKSKSSLSSRNIIPLDCLITGGDISVYLYSKEEDESLQVLKSFLLVELSQPSLIVSMSKKQQRIQLSLYNMTLHGQSDRKPLKAKNLPEASDFPVPWMETCRGEPDPKTGVRPALFTLCVSDFLINEGEFHVKIARPVKLSLSIKKAKECLDFLQKVQSSIRRKRRESRDNVGERIVPQTVGVSLLPDTKVTAAAPEMAGTPQILAEDTLNLLSIVKNVSLQTTQIVVVIATIPSEENPHVSFSLAGCDGSVTAENSIEKLTAKCKLQIFDVLLKTSYQHETKPLIGPVSFDVVSSIQWKTLKGSSLRSMVSVQLGHIPICFGQEHFNCLVRMSQEIGQFTVDTLSQMPPKTSKESVSKPEAVQEGVDKPVHSLDDLRSGAFRYVMEPDACVPAAYQILFTMAHKERHSGIMTWCYPEERVLTGISLTPIPICQALTNKDADRETLEVPCVLEYWDELLQCFHPFRQLFVSETNSCHISIPAATSPTGRRDMVAARIWRVVLNPSEIEGMETPPLLPKAQELVLSPMALAASMRVDSCISPLFIPSSSLSLLVPSMEVRLVNHLSQVGRATPNLLKPFTFDGTMPNEQEFGCIAVSDLTCILHQWNKPKQSVQVEINSTFQMDLVNFGNLTMSPLLDPFPVEATCMIGPELDIHSEMKVGKVDMRVGQSTLNTLHGAAVAWAQINQPDKPQHIGSYYIMCNNTEASLRFGQIHTDESVVLESRQMHAYSWRSHKQHRKAMHVCIEGWRNFRWSEPFSIEDEGTIVRTLKNREQKVTLFIRIKQVSAFQRQIIFHGQQNFVNHLTLPVEIHIAHVTFINDRGVESHQILSNDAKKSLPSLLLNDSEVIGVKVKLGGMECDWSEQFAISGEMKQQKIVIKVPSKERGLFYFWCNIIEEVHSEVFQRAIIFSPLFIVQNYLPHPLMLNVLSRGAEGLQSMQVKGQGHLTPLYHVNPSVKHLATFQLNPETAPSSPALPISTETDLAEKSEKKSISVQNIIMFDEETPSPWPSSVHQRSLLPGEPHDHPETDLQVDVTNHWSHLDALLINVSPWCLLVNDSDMSVTVTEEDQKRLVIGRNQIVAPQRFKKSFHICVDHNGDAGISKPIVIKEDLVSPYIRVEQAPELHVYIDGYVTVEIPLKEEGRKNLQTVFYHHLAFQFESHLRILTLRSKFIFVNEGMRPLAIRTIELDSSVMDRESLNAVKPQILHPAHLDAPPTCIHWDRLLGSSSNQNIEWLRYVSFALIDSTSTAESELSGWSQWIKVDSNMARQPVAVACNSEKGELSTEAFIVITQEEKGVVYILIDKDPTPRTKVINACSFPIQIGQAVPFKLHHGTFKVLEELGDFPERCVIPPHHSVHYCLHPTSDTNYISRNSTKVHLALAQFPGTISVSTRKEPSVPQGVEWSDGISLASLASPSTSEIVYLPNGGYVLVTSSLVGSVTTIKLESLSMESPKRGKHISTMQHSLLGVKEGIRDSSSKRRGFTLPENFQLQISVQNIGVSLMDEVTSSLEGLEFVHISIIDGTVITFPIIGKDMTVKGVRSQMFQIAARAVQVDNEMCLGERYDFPVIFEGKEAGNNDSYEDSSWSDLSNVARCQKDRCFIAVDIQLQEQMNEKPELLSLQVHANDGEVFIEDQFIYDVIRFMKTFQIHTYEKSVATVHQRRVSSKVMHSIQALKHPISMQHLSIKPITIIASVHASLKAFIALDRTQLHFGQFESGPVFATMSQLGQALTLHYTSGAIFKAGWALGSLDILGNPAGLLRSVKSGLADSLYLPYEGLTRGPTAFISGVGGGLKSLVTQVTAGTLTSVTKFASSVSRNLDRLSLDEDHIVRQEAARRKIPDHWTAGVKQGLSHFGISLLGAIAGIADQPIRNFQRSSETPRTSPREHARGVISGIGKGLVGAVVKPIGGAAELVSQTGQGILHGSGLVEVATPLVAPRNELVADNCNGALKYVWKMLHSIPKAIILIHVPVTIVTYHGLHHEATLLLTPEVLFVISNSEDTQQQVFSIHEVECAPMVGSDEGLVVTVTSGMDVIPSVTSPPPLDNSYLVEDFVATTSNLISSPENGPSLSSDSQSEISVTSEKSRFTYFMNKHQLPTFLSLFRLAKEHLFGEGFCYDETEQVTFRQFRSWHQQAEKSLDVEVRD